MANITKTFFQAIDDKDTTVRGLTFEQWLAAAKAAFNVKMGAEQYSYEVLHAFYPNGIIDDIVSEFESGVSAEDYATYRYSLARG